MDKTANVNFVKDMVINSEYTLLGDTLWFLKTSNLLLTSTLQKGKTTGFFGRKTTSYSNVRFAQEIPDTITNITEKVLVKEGALNQDNKFWQESRPLN